MADVNVGIHQPDYIPWLGLFYKMYLSDVFVHLDDAQYSNTAAHNFNKIKVPQGEYVLKFPVEKNFGAAIMATEPKYSLGWPEKHVKTLEMAYAKARYFKETFPAIKDILLTRYPDVAALNITLNEYIAAQFGITPRFVRSSSFAIMTKREEKVIDLCEAVGATRYISGNGARAYQKEENFLNRGIQLSYIDYQPVAYSQLWGGFLYNMSALDYIFNCGYDWEYVVNEVSRLNERNR